MFTQIRVGDLVELTSSALFAVASEFPALFKMMYQNKVVGGVVTELSDTVLRVDMGDPVNRQHPGGRNESPRGVPLALNQMSAQRLATVVRSGGASQVPMPPRAMPHQQPPIPAMHEAVPPPGSLMQQLLGQGAVIPLTDEDGTLTGCQTMIPMTQQMQDQLWNRMQDRVPTRVQVAMSVLNMYLGMKQYAIWQAVNLHMENQSDEDETPGEQWKQHGPIPQPADVRLEDYEAQLCHTAANTIQHWMMEASPQP